MVDVQTKASKIVEEPGEAIKKILQDVNDVVHKEVVKGSPDKELLDTYSKLYSSLAAIAATIALPRLPSR